MRLTPKDLQNFSKALHSHHVGDSRILRMLHKMAYADLQDLHEATQGRIHANRRVAECSEHGYVAVIESGTDCDGSRYSDHVHIFPSTLSEFWLAIDRMYANAEGPIGWYIEKPSFRNS